MAFQLGISSGAAAICILLMCSTISQKILLFYTVSIPLLESLQLRSSCHFFVQDFPV
jgi:hypothetical protein